MPLELHPLWPSQFDMYPNVCAKAFVPGILEVLYPNGYSQDARNYAVTSLHLSVKRRPERHQLFKVIDTDLPDNDEFSKIVGVSSWAIYRERRGEEEMRHEGEEAEREEKERGPSPGESKEADESFHGVVDAGRKKHIGGSPHVMLKVLATRPEHGRRGVGALHLAWGTAKADELDLPCFLEGSPMGVPLYKRWGFEAIETLPFDARQLGYHDALTHVFMRRPAKSNTIEA